MFRANLLTAVVSCGAVLPYLLRSESGTIINVGSMGAIKATCGMGAYAASKAGVVKLTEALADELKNRGITVNAILPSVLDTPRNRADMPGADFTRWVSPKAVAEVIVFLVSDLARAISGATLSVAGAHDVTGVARYFRCTLGVPVARRAFDAIGRLLCTGLPVLRIRK